MGQKQAILEHLQAGRSLTALGALSLFNCLSLSQRIGNLKKAGHPIKTQMVKLNNGKYVAEYRLVEPI